MKTEKTDLLMNVMNAKGQEVNAYCKLSDAVYEFEEKWDKKGINFSAYADYKTKRILSIRFNMDNLPELDVFNEIIEEFKEEFNVELTEIIEETYLETSSRTFSYKEWRYVFQHVDRFNDVSNESSKKMRGMKND